MVALAGVPANHGIAPAIEITIQPGSTERLVNVDVSCPAGGPSCVFGVARDGMITYRATGGTPTIVAATAVLTEIPTNHGIASADDITVQPGSTERLGNVDVSCPAGGPACVFSVAGDGTVAYRATGGMPTVVAATAVLTAVPANHGIAPANEITIQPGSTERLGNVDVSCPAGGPSCVFGVAKDGMIAYRATGGTPTIVAATAILTDFPADHGIAPTDEITIQPGSTERLGNVDVSCPTGGPTCFVSVAGDGTVAYRRTGGMPTVVSMSAKWPFSPVAGSTPDAAIIIDLIYDYAGASSWGNVACCRGWERVTIPSPPSEDMPDIQLYDWSYWTDPDMSPDIIKLQKTRPGHGRIDDTSDDDDFVDRTVFGVLDHGVIWISDRGYTDLLGDSPFGAGYYVHDRTTFDLTPNNRPDIYIVGASWHGDALGIGKELRNFITGQAAVRIVEVGRRQMDLPDLRYVLDIDIQFINSDSISMTAAGDHRNFGGAVYPGSDFATDNNACHVSDHCTPYASAQGTWEPWFGELHRVNGMFIGPNAEEVVGHFESEQYFGSFGAIRSP